MLTRCLILIGIISIMPVVLGCSGTTPTSEQTLLERNWGRSFEAGKNLDPILGLDGNASDHNVNKYQESFKGTEQKESETILKLQ
jgi:hypothetical protein